MLAAFAVEFILMLVTDYTPRGTIIISGVIGITFAILWRAFQRDYIIVITQDDLIRIPTRPVSEETALRFVRVLKNRCRA